MELIDFVKPKTNAEELTERAWKADILRGGFIRAHYEAHIEEKGISFNLDREPPPDLVEKAKTIFSRVNKRLRGIELEEFKENEELYLFTTWIGETLLPSDFEDQELKKIIRLELVQKILPLKLIYKEI